MKIKKIETPKLSSEAKLNIAQKRRTKKKKKKGDISHTNEKEPNFYYIVYRRIFLQSSRLSKAVPSSHQMY